jgi:hypothetical protein
MLSLLILCVLFSPSLLAQHSPRAGGHRTGPDTYEDDEVKVAIPAGWTRMPGKHPEGTLLLAKDSYILTVQHRSGHATGGTGGRFIEAFSIPWLNTDNAWTCSTVLRQIPQPASRTLLFENILINTADPHVRSQCGIPKDLSKELGAGSTRKFAEANRWFAGYFTSGVGGYFFDGSAPNSGCLSKVYKLSAAAQRPEQLPLPQDPHLQRIIQESIDIVGSIHYKACAPRPASPFE